MNNREKDCARELLSGLQDFDLVELCKTVTKGKLNPSTVQDAVELIVRYETDLKSLLNRKKISSTLLSQYLHCKNVKFSIDSNKGTLSELVLELWASTTSPLPIADHQHSTPYTSDSAASKDVVKVNSQDTLASDSNNQVALTESDASLLGVQFTDWFYSQLRGPDLELRSVESQHFFSDATCRVLMGTNDSREGMGSEGCASTITTALRLAGDAIPVANADSVRSQSSPHGGVKVLAFGTLHARPNCMLGAFEQAFLLVRDPSATDNWKIRYTELRLKVLPTTSRQIEPTHLDLMTALTPK